MDDSRQPRQSRRQVSGTFSRRYERGGRWLALLAGCALLLGLALQIYGLSPVSTVHSAPLIPADANPTATPTATATQAAIPPTLALAVPSSGQGPVGAHLTITGSNWGAADVLVGVALPGASCADPNSWAQTFNHVRPEVDQSIVFTFDWPSSLTEASGLYSICASNSAGVASTSYQVVSSSPPSLTLDPLTVHAGELVKVTGQNFLGSGSVTLSVTDAQGKSRTLTTLSPDASGTFSLTFQPRPTDVGDEVMHALTSAPQGMRPALQADAKLHVDVALTPTPGVTPTTVVVAPTKAVSSGGGNSSLPLIVGLIVGILLVLLVAAGVIFYFLMRHRANPETGTEGFGSGPGYGGGSGPDYSRQGAMYGDPYGGGGFGGAVGMGGLNDENWDAPTQAGYPTYDQGGYPPQPGYDPNAGWPDPDQPDPNWRPRPMTGQWRGAPQDYGDDPYGSYGGYGGQDADTTGSYPAPQDPWGAPGASTQQPRPSQGSGYPPAGPRSRGSGGGLGRGASGGQRSTGGHDPYPDEPPPDDWQGW